MKKQKRPRPSFCAFARQIADRHVTTLTSTQVWPNDNRDQKSKIMGALLAVGKQTIADSALLQEHLVPIAQYLVIAAKRCTTNFGSAWEHFRKTDTDFRSIADGLLAVRPSLSEEVPDLRPASNGSAGPVSHRTVSAREAKNATESQQMAHP